MVAVVEPVQEVDAFAARKRRSISACVCACAWAKIGEADTYCLLSGSRSLSFWRTRTSILLASRYFGMARMILIATRLLVSWSTASTTLPNVPWPRSFIVRSSLRGGRQGQMDEDKNGGIGGMENVEGVEKWVANVEVMGNGWRIRR